MQSGVLEEMMGYFSVQAGGSDSTMDYFTAFLTQWWAISARASNPLTSGVLTQYGDISASVAGPEVQSGVLTYQLVFHGGVHAVVGYFNVGL